MTLSKLKTEIFRQSIEELKLLSKAWHNMNPINETPERNKWNVHVGEFGGYASLFFPEKNGKVILHELDELIFDLEDELE